MNKLTKFMTAGGGVLTTLALGATSVFAQGAGQIKILPDKAPTIAPGPLVGGAVNLIFLVSFLIVFVILIIGGIRWMLAGGDEKAVAAAKGMVTGALIGLVIVLAAYTIIRFVGIFFGVNVFEFQIPTPINETPPTQ